MSKKLKNPEEGNKNIGRGIGILLGKTEEPKKQQKEKEGSSSTSFDTKDVTSYPLRIPNYMFEALKFDLSREHKSNIRDLILAAVQEKYNIYPPKEE